MKELLMGVWGLLLPSGRIKVTAVDWREPVEYVRVANAFGMIEVDEVEVLVASDFISQLLPSKILQRSLVPFDRAKEEVSHVNVG